MKALLAGLGLLVICALLLFVPHHRRVENETRSCTLAEIYAELVKGMPSDLPARGVIWLVLLGSTGMLAAAFPALFVGLTQWTSPDIRDVVCVMGGVLAVIGAGANFLAMLVSHMMIGFGSSSSSRDQTQFIWIIPAFQAFFGLASIAVGSSDRFAGRLNHWLN